MRQSGFVKHDPVSQFLIKQGPIRKQQVFMVIHKGFLQGTLEPFTVSVHFGSFRVGMSMSEALFQMGPGKRSLEFAALICQGLGLSEHGMTGPFPMVWLLLSNL